MYGYKCQSISTSFNNLLFFSHLCNNVSCIVSGYYSFFPLFFWWMRLNTLLLFNIKVVFIPENSDALQWLWQISRFLLFDLLGVFCHTCILPNIFDTFQSGYRQNHSTETALLKITNSIFMSYFIPAWLIYSLMLLIMLIRLQNCLPSLVLLSNGFLHTCPCMSSSGPLMCGVPQSSILGPILFSLYIHPH